MNASNHPGLGIPKGEPRKREKDREKRLERKIIQIVRPQVEERDGHCRLQDIEIVGECDAWRSEWAHWGPYKRAQTRGKPPEERHTTAGSLMMCVRHHDDYDEGRIGIEAKTDRECDGPLRVTKDGHVFEEQE